MNNESVDSIEPVEPVEPEKKKRKARMHCHINPKVPVKCSGECRGASTHWYWDSCGYGHKTRIT